MGLLIRDSGSLVRFDAMVERLAHVAELTVMGR